MNTKFLMSASAILMGIAGIILIFLPDEIANSAGLASTDFSLLLLQVLGSLYFAFAVLNWLAKANLIGGIYSKPVAVGNFAHFCIAGLALVKGAFVSQNGLALWVGAAIYCIFAILFAVVAFGNPLNTE